MARPRKPQNDGRTERYELRLSKAERDQLEAAAALRRVSPADFLRAAFLASAGPSLAPLSATLGQAIDPAAIAALNRVGANLNQITRRIHTGDVIQPLELPEVLASLAQHLDRIETLVFAAIEA